MSKLGDGSFHQVPDNISKACDNAYQVVVLLNLLQRADKKGESFPSITTLAQGFMAKMTVIRALKALEAKGLIKALRVFGKVNHYIINYSVLVDIIANQSTTDTSLPQIPVTKVDYTSLPQIPPPVTQVDTNHTHINHTQLTIPNYTVIFDLWNSKGIIYHKKLTDDMKRAIGTALKDYSLEEVSRAINNYAEILKAPQYYFKYKWVLKDFLRRGLEKFMDRDVSKQNYLKAKSSGNKPVLGEDKWAKHI